MVRILRTAAIAVAVLLLAGCVGERFSDLEGPATADDVLPADLPDYASEEIDADSVRYVGEHEGRTFYLALRDPSGICVIVYQSSEQWVSGCGGMGNVSVYDGTVTASVVPDGSPVPENGIRIGNNIVLED